MARIMIRGTTIHGTMMVGTMTPGIMIHGITGHIIRIIIGIMTRITAGDGHITGITARITDTGHIGTGTMQDIIMEVQKRMTIIL
jgi:hypothetical protein